MTIKREATIVEDGKDVVYKIETVKTKRMLSARKLCTDKDGTLDEGKLTLMMLSYIITEPKVTYEDLEEKDMTVVMALTAAFEDILKLALPKKLTGPTGSSAIPIPSGTPTSTAST